MLEALDQVVRYLQDNGSMVQEGEPYVELEARECLFCLEMTTVSTSCCMYSTQFGRYIRTNAFLIGI